MRNIWQIDQNGAPTVVGIFRYGNGSDETVNLYRCDCLTAMCAFKADFPVAIPAKQTRWFPIRFEATEVADGQLNLKFVTDAGEPVEIDWVFQPASDSWDDVDEKSTTPIPDPSFSRPQTQSSQNKE